MPAVSVIIPTYNRASYLAQAIQSVLDQPFTDFEVIVVDDGSTDATTTVVQGFQDRRIRYLRQDHQERSAARNHGLEAAQGEFLAFLDDDDWYLPNKLRSQVAFLRAREDVDLVGSGYRLVDEQGKVLQTMRPWEVQPDFTLLSCLYSCQLVTSTVLFRHRVLDRLDHWFDLQLCTVEDADFFIRMAHAGCQMVWLREIVSAYRLHNAHYSVNCREMRRCYQRILGKVFSLPDLPSEVLAERDRIYAHFHLALACRAYASGQVPAAQFNLLRAWMLQPALVREAFASVVARFASLGGADPQPYIRFVNDHLPAPLTFLRTQGDGSQLPLASHPGEHGRQ